MEWNSVYHMFFIHGTLCKSPNVFIIMALEYSLKSESVMPPALFLLKITHHSFLTSHMSSCGPHTTEQAQLVSGQAELSSSVGLGY